MLKKSCGFNKHQRNITENRINVLLETEMSVENESIDQNIQPFQIFKILQSVRIITLWRVSMPYSELSGKCANTGNTESCMDFLNNSK